MLTGGVGSSGGGVVTGSAGVGEASGAGGAVHGTLPAARRAVLVGFGWAAGGAHVGLPTRGGCNGDGLVLGCSLPDPPGTG